jgi:ATP-binding cassette subfamily B protein
VLSLLLRFYDPSDGTVLFDGRDIRAATQASLRAQMAVVFQENVLFNTTIRENIRVGRPEATDAEVEAAARAAEIHDFIAGLPGGYETLTGERGGRLSGGQRQRIAIARAMLREPAVLLLDEATSALDPAAEAAVNATIARLARGRTVIAVTHRLASVTDADQIFVMAEGRVVEQGRHEALLHQGGEYARLWRKQSGFALEAHGESAQVEAARLRSVRPLAGLEDAVLAELTPRFVTEQFPPGRVVVREGDPGDRFYIIVRGAVEVVKSDGEETAERRLAVLEDGDYFGEIALLTSRSRTATVRALRHCTCLSLSRGHFHDMVKRFPTLRAEITRAAETRSEGLKVSI